MSKKRGGGISDDTLLVLVGGGAAAYLLYKSRDDSGNFDLSKLLPFLGEFGGGAGFDLSGLLSGLNLGGGSLGGFSDLGGAFPWSMPELPTKDEIVAILRGMVDEAAKSDPGKAEAAAPSAAVSGNEPSVTGEPTFGITYEGFSGTVSAFSDLDPWAQRLVGGGVGAGLGAAAYMAVKTAPAVGRLAMAGANVAYGGANAFTSLLSRSTARLVGSGSAVRSVNTARAATAARSAGAFVPRVGPMSYAGMGALGRVGLAAGAILFPLTVAATGATILGRVMFGADAPSKVVGWGPMSLLSLSELTVGGLLFPGRASAAPLNTMPDAWMPRGGVAYAASAPLTPGSMGGRVTSSYREYWSMVSPGSQPARARAASAESAFVGAVARAIGSGSAGGSASTGASATAKANLGLGGSGSGSMPGPSDAGYQSYWSSVPM